MAEGGDGVPLWVRQRAVELFDEHQADLPVAELRYDSLLDETAARGDTRTVRFGLREHEVWVTFSPPAADELHVQVRITPPGRYHLVARLLDTDEVQVTTGDDGQATMAGLPHRPGSLLVTPAGADGPAWRTAWTRW